MIENPFAVLLWRELVTVTVSMMMTTMMAVYHHSGNS
jgi:hypothetical protein